MNKPLYGSVALTIRDGEYEYADTVAFQVPEGCGLQETAQAIVAYYLGGDSETVGDIQEDGSFEAPGDYRILEMDSFKEISPLEYQLTEPAFGTVHSQRQLASQISELQDEPWFLEPGQTEPKLSVVHGLDLSAPEQVSALLLAVQEHMSQQPLAFKEKVAAQVQAKSLEKTTNKSRTGSER